MSHRAFAAKSFFRHLTPPVLASLARALGVDLTHPAGGRAYEQAHAAWSGWSELDQQRFERDVRPIHELSTTHARVYLDDLARLVTGGDATFLTDSLDWTVNDLAARLWVADRRSFSACHQEYATDNLAHFTEYRGKRRVDLRGATEAGRRIERQMRDFVRAHAGGLHTAIETFEGADKFGFFLYREGAAESRDAFDPDGQLVPLLQRSVVKVAALWSHSDCTLSVKAATRDEREKLRDVIASEAIGDPDYFLDNTSTPRFDFGFLRDPQRALVADPSLGIARVWVSKLEVVPLSRAERLTLKVPPGLDLATVHDLAANHNVDLARVPIVGVDLGFEMNGKGRARHRTITLRNPGSTNLNDTPRDRCIRKGLVSFGINAHHERVAKSAEVVGR